MRKDIWGQEPKKQNGTPTQLPVTPPTPIIEVVDNRIYFYSAIESSQILKLNKELRILSNSILSSSQLREDSHLPPIYLHVHSFGGYLFDGLAALDEIRNSKVPITTIVDGCCASAATFLTIVGKHRLINQNSFMLIHQLSSCFWGKYEEFRDEMKNYDRLMKTIRNIYGQYTKIPQDKLNEILKHDLWLDAKTCVKYGLVDEVL
jgi:ATP-dependent protease ClpP protease subunit